MADLDWFHEKKQSSLTEYTYEASHNRVGYLCGGVWDENSWDRLSVESFTVVFLDALHDPKALLFEFEMIKKYKLLNEDVFIMFWDDLGGEMTLSFMHI